MPTLRPFFGYYGGKWRDAVKNYPAPRHQTIVEPFAGSAGYSVRYPGRRVVLCDLDPVIVGVWRYLIAVTPLEVLALPDLPEGGTVDDLTGIPQEARWLIGFWLNKGNAAPCKTPSAWMRSGKYPNSFWGDRVRLTIASQVDHIKHWQVHQCTYQEAPVTGPATWFVDPPYREAGKYYRFGSSGIDYRELGDWCQTREGQVIACEATGADWLPFTALADIKTTRAGRKASEALWVS